MPSTERGQLTPMADRNPAFAAARLKIHEEIAVGWFTEAGRSIQELGLLIILQTTMWSMGDSNP